LTLQFAAVPAARVLLSFGGDVWWRLRPRSATTCGPSPPRSPLAMPRV